MRLSCVSIGLLSRLTRFLQFVSVLSVFAVSPVPLLLAQLAPAVVTLTTSATPSTAEPGVTVVGISGTGFPSGTINPADVQVQLQPMAPGIGPAMVAAVSAVTTLYGSTRRVSFQVFPANGANNVHAPTLYLASVAGKTTTGLSFSSINNSSLTINPPAAIQ
jgi:hypothetical protein